MFQYMELDRDLLILVGASRTTISRWRKGLTRPQGRYEKRIVALKAVIGGTTAKDSGDG